MGKTYIVLHKSEWDRLHRKTNDSHRLPHHRDEYFRKLVDKSQSWIRTWPDSVEGHIKHVEKQKEKQHEEEIATLKKGHKKKKQEDTKQAISYARQLIFEDSCYGRQLISALRESKNFEILDEQIKFQKELKEKALKQEKEMQSKFNLDQCSFNLDKTQEMAQRKRAMEIELAQINKSMYNMEISNRLKTKEQQIKTERENAQLMQELLENEAQRERDYELSLRREMELFEKEQKLARERKAESVKKLEVIANAQRMEIEKKQCKMNIVLKQIYEDQHKTEKNKKNHELVKQKQQEEQMRYDEFIKRGIEEMAQGSTKKEHENAAKEKADQEARRMLAKCNKLAAEEVLQMRQAEKLFNKCVGYRQSILPKSCQKRNVVPTLDDSKDMRSLQFLNPSKKLQDKLNARRAQPTPWNALSATHAHFAEQAGQTLRECRHKRFARKVVDVSYPLVCDHLAMRAHAGIQKVALLGRDYTACSKLLSITSTPDNWFK